MRNPIWLVLIPLMPFVLFGSEPVALVPFDPPAVLSIDVQIEDGQVVGTGVAVVGSSSAGVAAAVTAARQGADVLLVSEHDRLGGMVTNGVTTDAVSNDSIRGIYAEWRGHVASLYLSQGIEPSRWRGGLFAPPSVAEPALMAIVNAEPISIARGWWVDHLDEEAAVVDEGGAVDEVQITDGSAVATVRADVYIDATVEGDLLAAAGTEGRDYVWGREAVDTYGEPVAPEKADQLLQASTYRVTAQVNSPPVDAPARYQEWLPLYEQVPMDTTPFDCWVWDGWRPRHLQGGRLQRCLPGRRLDINIDLVGVGHDYLVADRERRREIEEVYRSFVEGWLHYLYAEHGWPIGVNPDEYPESQGWPEVLYLREGRRLIGNYTFTYWDARQPGPSGTAVAVGDYGMDSHCVAGSVSGASDCEGAFWVPVRTYGVPLGVIVPRRLTNMLVPVAVSSSRVGYQTLRMEPVRMQLGEAAGIAATLVGGRPVQEIDVEAVLGVLDPEGDLRDSLIRGG